MTYGRSPGDRSPSSGFGPAPAAPALDSPYGGPAADGFGGYGATTDGFGGAALQLDVATERAGGDAGAAHDIAAQATAGPGGELPHLDTIQQAFGPHDVSGVRAHTDGAAADGATRLGAHAFATGHDVAFASPTPDLHTAAHEAAHVVQQRAGVHLKDGLGEAGDAHERHADAVADAVVRGESAAALLGPVAASRPPRSNAAPSSAGATTRSARRSCAARPPTSRTCGSG